MLRPVLLALAVLGLAAPAAAADGAPEEPEAPPCDGRPLVGPLFPEDQVRALAFACTYAPGLLQAACGDSGRAIAYASYWSGFFLAYFGHGTPVPARGLC